MHDLDASRADGRHLHLAVERHDAVLHGSLQMALLSLLRAHAPDLATIEDLRLAVDEVLLGTVVVDGRPVTVDVVLDDSGARVSIEVEADLDLPVAILSALVDDVTVRRPGEHTTQVHLTRSWHAPGHAT